jgi:malate/lactate dehydrogenase
MAQQTSVGYTYLVNCFMSPNLKHELKLIDIKNKTYKKRGMYRKMYTLNYEKLKQK